MHGLKWFLNFWGKRGGSVGVGGGCIYRYHAIDMMKKNINMAIVRPFMSGFMVARCVGGSIYV